MIVPIKPWIQRTMLVAYSTKKQIIAYACESLELIQSKTQSLPLQIVVIASTVKILYTFGIFQNIYTGRAFFA